MLFDDSFITSVKDDPIGGVIEICRRTKDELTPNIPEWTDEEYNALTEALALLGAIEEAELAVMPILAPEITGEMTEDCPKIRGFIEMVGQHFTAKLTQLKVASMKSHFSSALSAGFCYEFSQGDLERVQRLINELRDKISSSPLFEKDHRQRLLKRLERLQVELHKKVSDLDRFWGLVGDAGVALRKFGEDAKPLVDRISEIARIVWNTQARAEELPSESEFPLLDIKKDS